jgi:hypothetical protein
MEDDTKGGRSQQAYRMMDINELDEHHMATITRKSNAGLNLMSEEDESGVVFESRSNKKRHGSNSREGRNSGNIQQ